MASILEFGRDGKPRPAPMGRMSKAEHRKQRGPLCSMTCEHYYEPEQVEFMMAMESYKRRVNPYPTAAEVLAVAKSLGYRKTPGPVEGR